jgi:hypothetical protein
MDSENLYYLPKNVETRWASMENPLGRPGSGGQANDGRKGSPCRGLKAGESFVMAQVTGAPGVVRRIWVTIWDRRPEMLRGLVLRITWDGEQKPAVEAPIGDFFGVSLGRNAVFSNAWFDNPEGRSFNCRIPMPFRSGFSMSVTNESDRDLWMFYYDVNYTVGDEHSPQMGYLHSHFRREAPTTLRRDFEILPQVYGRGRFLGSTLGVIADTSTYGHTWWGEGEVKAYLDGDGEFPTLCGTGTEDYIATGWGQGQYSGLWHGCPIADHDAMQYSFYRLHGPDPVYFQRQARVTIQQIGWSDVKTMQAQLAKTGLPGVVRCGADNELLTIERLAAMKPDDNFIFERQDDWCATSYFYLDSPINALPAIQPYAERVAGLTGDPV